MRALWMYCSGENICSSCWPSWNSPTTPRDFDVGENLFEIADSGGELLHLAEALLDFAEVGGDLAEGFGEAGLESSVEFLVDGDAHLFELGGIVIVEFGEPVFDGEAEFFLLGVGFAGDFR